MVKAERKGTMVLTLGLLNQVSSNFCSSFRIKVLFFSSRTILRSVHFYNVYIQVRRDDLALMMCIYSNHDNMFRYLYKCIVGRGDEQQR